MATVIEQDRSLADAALAMATGQPMTKSPEDALKRQLEETIKRNQKTPEEIEAERAKERAAQVEKVTAMETKTEAVIAATTKPTPPVAAKSGIPVRMGRIRSARRFVVFGPPGVGKTTLAADSDDPIISDVDDGSKMMPELPRYIYNEADLIRGHVPRTLGEYIRSVRHLADPRVVHPYKTFWTDSWDRLEALIMTYCFKRDSVGREKPIINLEGYGYNKGPSIILDEVRVVLGELDRLIERGINVGILAHSTTKKFANPAGEDYDRYQMKCTPAVGGLLGEWADEQAFFHYEEGAAKSDANPMKKAKGWSTGNRVLEFDRTAQWDAKARLPLPSRVVVGNANPWAPFRAAISQAFTAGAPELRDLISEQIARIGDPELAEKVIQAVAGVADNVTKLTAYLSDLRRRPAVETDTPQGDGIAEENRE